jgi:hypothetical protein
VRRFQNPPPHPDERALRHITANKIFRRGGEDGSNPSISRTVWKLQNLNRKLGAELYKWAVTACSPAQAPQVRAKKLCTLPSFFSIHGPVLEALRSAPSSFPLQSIPVLSFLCGFLNWFSSIANSAVLGKLTSLQLHFFRKSPFPLYLATIFISL